jgi:hypothetical protein
MLDTSLKNKALLLLLLLIGILSCRNRIKNEDNLQCDTVCNFTDYNFYFRIKKAIKIGDTIKLISLNSKKEMDSIYLVKYDTVLIDKKDSSIFSVYSRNDINRFKDYWIVLSNDTIRLVNIKFTPYSVGTSQSCICQLDNYVVNGDTIYPTGDEFELYRDSSNYKKW